LDPARTSSECGHLAVEKTKISDMETSTLSKKQQEMRTGRFTGSEIYKLMGVKGFGKTGETYIKEKVAEHLTGKPIKSEFYAASTQWGIDHELEAKLYFEAATGKKIKNSETLDNGLICGTPDGLIENQPIGFEIKCPFNSGNHLKNLLLDSANGLLDLHPEYYWQIVAYMWITNYSKWLFCSYDPRFKEEKRMLILNVDLNPSHLLLMQQRVAEAKLMFDNIISKLK
jgi:hypothetical protein